MAFDWGPSKDAVIIALKAPPQSGGEEKVILLDTGTSTRTELLTVPALLRAAGLQGRGSLTGLALAPDRRRLGVSASVRGLGDSVRDCLLLYDLVGGGGHLLREFPPKETVGSFAWAPDGRSLAVGIVSEKSDLFVWEAAGTRQVALR